MAPQWETGMMVRTPSWHRLERVVLPDHVTDWDEPASTPASTGRSTPSRSRRRPHHRPGRDPGLAEDRPGRQEEPEQRILAVQPSTYAIIKIAEFGEVINTCLGTQKEPVKFEALMSLYGGRKIVALIYFEQPLALPWDPSETYTYVAFCCNFDGNGGLTGIPTEVRVQCANTWRAAEERDGKRVGFTIRHTKNWEERVAEVSHVLGGARKDAKAWVALGEKLALYKAGPRQRETFLKRFMPTAEDMGDRQVQNVHVARDHIRQILAGPTCDGIAGTGYGLVMAATEWADHRRTFVSDDSYVARQLLRKEAPKTRAFRVVRQMAGVKG